MFAQAGLSVQAFKVVVTGGNEITIGGGLCNGSTPESVVVRLYLDRASVPTSSSTDTDAEITTNSVAGECFSFSFPVSDLPAGSHSAYLFVDANDTISEADKTNNV